MGDLEEQENMVAQKFKNTGASAVKMHNAMSIEMKLKEELQKEIGLTNDEMTLIIYTSLDHDYLPNLLVLSGEFLKWFQMNFEGENNDETDFLDNKLEIWQSTTSLASDILNAH